MSGLFGGNDGKDESDQAHKDALARFAAANAQQAEFVGKYDASRNFALMAGKGRQATILTADGPLQKNAGIPKPGSVL